MREFCEGKIGDSYIHFVCCPLEWNDLKDKANLPSKSGEEKDARTGRMWWKELFKFDCKGGPRDHAWLKDCCVPVTPLRHRDNDTLTVDASYFDLNKIAHQGITFFFYFIFRKLSREKNLSLGGEMQQKNNAG